MPDKPKVFISHIGEEAALADILQRYLRRDFLDLIDIFVSSDGHSIQVGDRWLNEVDAALKSAKVELILCSEESVKRPWINFEAGAGWVKDIPVVPVCHTGMRKVDLPIPLNMLQAIVATNEAELRQLYDLLARQLGSAVPTPDLHEMMHEVAAFEHEYGVVKVVRAAVLPLVKLLPELEQLFRPNPVARLVQGPVLDWRLDQMQPHLDALQAAGMIEYAAGFRFLKVPGIGEDGSHLAGGNMIEIRVEAKEDYYRIADRVMA